MLLLRRRTALRLGVLMLPFAAACALSLLPAQAARAREIAPSEIWVVLAEAQRRAEESDTPPRSDPPSQEQPSAIAAAIAAAPPILDAPRLAPSSSVDGPLTHGFTARPLGRAPPFHHT